MSEYKITQVSAQPPRQWDGPNGTVWYIKVKLDGHAKPVSIGKRSPDALKVGDTVHGTIIEDGMHDEDKFKAEQNPAYSGGGSSASKPSYTPRDDMAIRAQWAIGQSMTATYNKDAGNIAEVELLATALFAMVDRVKEPTPTQDEVDADVAAAIDLFTKENEEF
jgi:hypothetical protein